MGKVANNKKVGEVRVRMLMLLLPLHSENGSKDERPSVTQKIDLRSQNEFRFGIGGDLDAASLTLDQGPVSSRNEVL